MSYLRSINEKIKNLPYQPGIYQFLNFKGDILYIGKAKNIKKRVSSYKNLSKLSFCIVLKGVAIDWHSSQIDIPTLFEPKSKPINLDFLVILFLNSSIVIILYLSNLSGSLPNT